MSIDSFYFHLRHPKDNAHTVVPYGLALDKKGPFFLFEKTDRVLNDHIKFFPSLATVPHFEYFRNFSVKIANENQRSTYLNCDNKFVYKDKLLKEVKTPDEQPSIVIDTGKFQPNPAISTKSSGDEIRKKRSSSPIKCNNKINRQILTIKKTDEFADKNIFDLVTKMRANGLEVFDPIKSDVEIWFNKFSAQLKLYDSEGLASKIIQGEINGQNKNRSVMQ